MYVNALIRELEAYDVSSRVIAPLAPKQPDGYVFEGATVRTYEVNDHPSRAELRGDFPPDTTSRFREILDEERPDIYHQHSWSRGLGGAHLHAAREAGIKTVVTVHVATAICMRGTMMQFGERPCDGRIIPSRCGACWSHGRGAPKFVANMLGAFPTSLAQSFERASCAYDGRLTTALSAKALAQRRKSDVLRMAADADRIVAVCGWLHEALEANGMPADKLVLSRQGVDTRFADAVRDTAPYVPSDNAFHLLYLGRWHPVKGIDVLVGAMRLIPSDVPITLTIHAAGDDDEAKSYADSIRRLAQGDARITIAETVTRERLPQVLAQADVLVVPSLGLETGPLVVLEAKASGLPIIGSRLGGIEEHVEEPDDGTLVPPGDVEALAAAIKAAAATRTSKPRSRVPPKMRTTRDVAAEMAELYRSLC